MSEREWPWSASGGDHRDAARRVFDAGGGWMDGVIIGVRLRVKGWCGVPNEWRVIGKASESHREGKFPQNAQWDLCFQNEFQNKGNRVEISRNWLFWLRLNITKSLIVLHF